MNSCNQLSGYIALGRQSYLWTCEQGNKIKKSSGYSEKSALLPSYSYNKWNKNLWEREYNVRNLLREFCLSARLWCCFSRWPKWRLHGPSRRTLTILDHVLNPTQPSRANWSLPNMAVGYSSGTGEAVPKNQLPSKTMSSVQKQLGYLWLFHLTGVIASSWDAVFGTLHWVGFGQGSCLNIHLNSCTSNTLIKERRMDCVSINLICFPTTSVNVLSEQKQHAVIIVVK